MEKLTWVKPEMEEVRFAANEYIASCGESSSSYKFECTAPRGILYRFCEWVGGQLQSIFLEGTETDKPNNLGSYVSDFLASSYHPCGENAEGHTPSKDDGFFWGFVDHNANQKYDENTDTAVIIWDSKDGWWGTSNYHATQNVNITSWETARS